MALLRRSRKAVVLVLVYVGAVMVLFLFVVMMLDINTEELRSGFTRYAWLGWITAAVIIVEIVGVVTAKSLGVDVTKGAAPLPPPSGGAPAATGANGGQPSAYTQTPAWLR